MLTIKKVKRTEFSLIKKLKLFWKNHPFISVSLVTIFCFGTAATIFLTLMLTVVGGGTFEIQIEERHDAGEISDNEYSIIETFLDIVIICIRYLSDIMFILVVIPIVLIGYKIFKWHLQYKHDNL